MSNPWSNVYGLARTILSLPLLLTLVFTKPDVLIRPGAGAVFELSSQVLPRLTLFGMLAPHYELARWLAIAGLLLVASGFRPRFTGVLHWWLCWSFMSVAVPLDGGDHVVSVLTLLLVPVTLTDARRWHWDAPSPIASPVQLVQSRIALSALFMCRLQVAMIYFHAAVGKFKVDEWLNGTAIYYWLLDPRIGVPTAHHPAVLRLLAPDWMAPLLTWVPIALELALFLALALPARHWLRRLLFVAGVLFHLGNILFFGLISFFLAMLAALVLLLRSTEDVYSVERLRLMTKRVMERFALEQPFGNPMPVSGEAVRRPP